MAYIYGARRSYGSNYTSYTNYSSYTNYTSYIYELFIHRIRTIHSSYTNYTSYTNLQLTMYISIYQLLIVYTNYLFIVRTNRDSYELSIVYQLSIVYELYILYELYTSYTNYSLYTYELFIVYINYIKWYTNYTSYTNYSSYTNNSCGIILYSRTDRLFTEKIGKGSATPASRIVVPAGGTRPKRAHSRVYRAANHGRFQHHTAHGRSQHHRAPGSRACASPTRFSHDRHSCTGVGPS